MPAPGIVELVVIALGVVIPIVLIVAIGRLILAPFRQEDPAVQIVKDRFASGEIDEAEYLRLRSVLQRG